MMTKTQRNEIPRYVLLTVGGLFMTYLYNVVDGIFVGQGVGGASGLGQISAVLVLLTHFIRKRGSLRLGRFQSFAPLMGKICKRGVPEAITQLNTPVTAFCYNLVLANLVGDMGVSTFNILSFIYSLANAILSDVAQGLQPLWGNYYGKKNEKGLKALLRDGLVINAVLSVLVYGFLLFAPVIRIFNQEPALVDVASKALPLFAISFIPMALNLIFTAYFYSTKRTLQADAIAVSRGIVVKAACIFLMPALLGEGVIWLAPLAAECITLVLALFLGKKSKLLYM